MMTDLFSLLAFAHGAAMKNRFMLAPLTNCQSHADGHLSDEERRWLTLRAEGGFGAVMTGAAHVQRQGQGFPGQLGIWSDAYLPGLSELASLVKAEGSLAFVQLDHAGMYSPTDLIGEVPQAPSVDELTGARALTLAEIEVLRQDFIEAAVRAERAGFDGVEIHSCYLLAQFLSAETNRRNDRYGGSVENRARLLTEVITGVRQRCGADFQLGLRLAPERFGVKLGELLDLTAQLMTSGMLDWINLHLWDVFKLPEEPEFKDKRLIEWFCEMPRGATKLGVAGNIWSGIDARRLLEQGVDFAVVGRAAMLHHDFPLKISAEPDFRATALPVTPAHLAAEGLSSVFIDRMRRHRGFITEEVQVSPCLSVTQTPQSTRTTAADAQTLARARRYGTGSPWVK